MLKITLTTSDTTATLFLEGRMVGPWVTEVRKSCENFLQSGKELRLNLAGVSFIDSNGLALLSHFRARGVALLDCSPFVEEQLKGL